MDLAEVVKALTARTTFSPALSCRSKMFSHIPTPTRGGGRILPAEARQGDVTPCWAMADHELKRSSGERRVYALEGVGTLRLKGFAARAATAEADGRRWQIGHRRFWQRAIQATDEEGTVIGEFEPRKLRRGGTLRWAGRELTLRPASRWRERYALADGDRELAVLDGKGWGKRPVEVTVDDPQAVEPGLVLFATFVVRGLAEDAAAAGATVAATSSGG